MFKKLAVFLMVSLLLLSLVGCMAEDKLLTCDGCGKIVHVSGDSNMEDSWLIFCEECEADLPL